MNETKILICDDHPVFRYGLKTLLEKKDFQIIEAADAADAIKKTVEINPDLIIMDYIIPQLNGMQTIDAIRRKGFYKKIILLSNVYEQELVKKCREIDLDGYICKSESLEEISIAITQVLEGHKIFIEPKSKETGLADSGNPFYILTEREIEVVCELITGKTQKEIADSLGISVRTIEKHRENISNKLGKISLPELTKKAFAWGLIQDNGLTSGYH